jgi:hypothetical protein
MEIILSKPVEWNGNSEKLELNLEGLTGSDLVQAEGEFLERHPGFVGVPSLQAEYQLCLAARALGRPSGDLKALPIRDCLNIVMAVQSFLFGSAIAGGNNFLRPA